ncbi:MAG TPA: YMGG-like glycine zipper-containing protein [Casimicrobiaceae bacterium]|nr:YMGG-like glycine zipper-containing protein [Casimicrobiaceae bacterium]
MNMHVEMPYGLARTAAIGCALLLGGCVMMPTAPMVAVYPGSAKGLDQFRADDGYCRSVAQAAVAGPSQAATNNAAANTAAATAIGAAAGAIIGSATGSAGPGAAIGAGTGLLFGGLASTDMYGSSYYSLQYQYDAVFAQCMYAQGNKVPSRFVRGSLDYSQQRYGPANPPAPSGGYAPANPPAPAGYPPPNPRPDSIPPPNTPPPRG